MKRLVENFREFMDLASINQGPDGWSIYGANPSKNDKEMVSGIIEIIIKVKDAKNRESIARDMVKKLKSEGVEIDSEGFLRACRVKTNSHRLPQRR